MDGRLRQADTTGEIAQPEPTRVLAERIQDADRAVHRLDRLLRYCRIPFDIVE
jgi:hypothetical protein